MLLVGTWSVALSGALYNNNLGTDVPLASEESAAALEQHAGRHSRDESTDMGRLSSKSTGVHI